MWWKFEGMPQELFSTSYTWVEVDELRRGLFEFYLTGIPDKKTSLRQLYKAALDVEPGRD